VEICAENNSLGVVGLGATESTLAAASFLDFIAAGLEFAAALDSGFLGLAIFLVAVSRHFRRHRDRLSIGIWRMSCGGLNDTPPR
jgi:hypothetical protein